MDASMNICSLDYLVGTLATAYKGLVTALVVKDFCVMIEDRVTFFKGTMISLPPGSYIIVLMQGGNEISRQELTNGDFILTADAAVIEAARNLQLDIIQSGKHIGTFLLKKEVSGGTFASAIEVSEDLRGIRFKALVDSIGGKEGMRKAAETVVSDILSAKKDWRQLSEVLHSFSKDLFWSARDAFYYWGPVLVRFSFKACGQVTEASKARAVYNAVSLVELPIEQEMDSGRLESFLTIWMQAASSATIDLSFAAQYIFNMLSRITTRLPELDSTPIITLCIASLRGHARSVPVLHDWLIDLVRRCLPRNKLAPVLVFSEAWRITFLEMLDTIDRQLAQKVSRPTILNQLASLDLRILDREELYIAFFGALLPSIDMMSDSDIAASLSGLPDFSGYQNPNVDRTVVINIKALLKALLSEKRSNASRLILNTISDSPVQDDILLSAEIAALILGSDDNQLVGHYRMLLKRIIVPHPRASGLSAETWAELVSPLHVRRISAFMAIIAAAPEKCIDILVHLICNLAVSGVWIPDDRIFQRDISAYLNSGALRTHFLYHYLLLKRLPCYFNDVGASGMIRDLSSDIDSWGNDSVLYFLRKQIHVNASNSNITLIEQIIRAWLLNDVSCLEGYVPEEILAAMDREQIARYSSALHQIFTSLSLLEKTTIRFDKLRTISDVVFDRVVESIDAPQEIRRKIILLRSLYYQVSLKYALMGMPRTASDSAKIVEQLGRLKTVYTSLEKTEAQESLYYKRHIAFGIPSVIGSYHETKFDALAEALRLEEQIRIFLEETIAAVESCGPEVDISTVRSWFDTLEQAHALFALHDLDNPRISEVLTIMKWNSLSLAQIKDLLKVWQRELTWMVEVFHRAFLRALTELLGRYPHADMPDFLRRLESRDKSFIDRAIDITSRDIINSIAGFEELDRLLNSCIKKLSLFVESGNDVIIPCLMPAQPEKQWFTLHGLSPAEAAAWAPMLGSKAKNLVYLKEKGLLVPPATVFPSSITSTHEEVMSGNNIGHAIREAVAMIEHSTGRTFGSAKNPLFLAVRSGSYLSMPGILSSILYCGMNHETIAGFVDATGDTWLAYDSYRRFIEHYAEIVLDVPSDVFEQERRVILERYHEDDMRRLDTTGLEAIVAQYLTRLSNVGRKIPDDPYEQLRLSMKAIYQSWNCDRALQFRKAMAVSDRWGTAVTLMSMVYGNRKGSGAAVFFTRVPVSFEKGIFGEVRETATGDDLVYGHFINRPLAQSQTNNGDSLEKLDPQLYRLFCKTAEKVEDAMGGLPQEVESAYVTVGDKRQIYIVQTKRMEFRRGPAEKFQESCKMESSVIGRGIGVYGGALSGVACFSASPEDIGKLMSHEKRPIILLRKETDTDDVAVMPSISGIVTSIGGATSHAAILSQKFSLTAVVGCSDMSIRTGTGNVLYAVIGGVEIHEGAEISIDGSTGLVYSGVCAAALRNNRYDEVTALNKYK